LVEDVNVRGPAVVAEAALHAGVRRMVHFASVHAFQQAPLDEPLDESRARVVHGLAYDRSKASGEAEVRLRISQGLDAVIVHPSGVIGPYDFAPSRMGKVFLDLYRGRLPALVPGGFDWVDARDVVAGAIAAMERGIRGRSYLLSGHYAGIPELSAIAAGLTGRPAPRLQVPLWLAKVGAPFMQLGAQLLGVEPLYTLESLHALQANRVYVRTRAAQDLGHAPRPLHESVRDTYRWFAQAGRLPRDLLERLG
jgi:dihydroflavonol-4-reductase